MNHKYPVDWAQRVILANQHDILGRLDESNREDHSLTADALRNGHAYIYNKRFELVESLLSQAKQDRVCR